MSDDKNNESVLDINRDWPSPNFGDREGAEVSILVVHYTAMSSVESTIKRFSDTSSQVSAHYVISRNGEIFQMVDEDKRAWHAGVAFWRGIQNVNSYSIGIELDHDGIDAIGHFIPYATPQLQSLKLLAADIIQRHQIPMQNIVGHSDVAPMRKQDPGNTFPWKDFADEGIGFWPKQVPTKTYKSLKSGDKGDEVRDLQMALGKYGYGITVDGDFGIQTEAVIIGFQRHFCADNVDGIAGNQTRNMLDAVLKSV